MPTDLAAQALHTRNFTSRCYQRCSALARPTTFYLSTPVFQPHSSSRHATNSRRGARYTLVGLAMPLCRRVEGQGHHVCGAAAYTAAACWRPHAC